MSARTNDAPILRSLRRHGPQTVRDLSDRLPIPHGSVGVALRRMAKQGKAQRIGKRKTGTTGQHADVWAIVPEAT